LPFLALRAVGEGCDGAEGALRAGLTNPFASGFLLGDDGREFSVLTDGDGLCAMADDGPKTLGVDFIR